MTLASYFDRLGAELDRAAARQAAVRGFRPPSAEGANPTDNLDLELALLLFDSASDRQLVGLRGHGDRQLTFSTDGGITVELDVDGSGLVGMVVPPSDKGRDAQIETDGSTTAVEIDDLGRFFLDRVPAGPFRLLFEVEGRRVGTEWITL